MRIHGQVVIVTGASEGIGAACAREFARRGARLSLTARRGQLLESIVPGSLTTPGDLCDANIRRAIVERTLEHYGRVDVLINNAGIGLYAPSWSAPEQDVRHLFELNFFAAWDMIRLVAPGMRQQRSGMIVNVGSIAGRVTLPWFTMYSATKYALGSLTEGLRMELARDGVRTMSVCPGYVRTLFQQHVLSGQPPESVVRSKRFAVTAERCAEAIADGVERDARTVVTPRIGWMMIAFARLFPATLEGRLAGILHGNASAGKAS